MIRIYDIFFSILSISFLLPLFIITILILSLTGEKEVFYLQNRVGKNGKLFKLIKFATMLKNSPNIGSGTITLENDERVLPVGKFLRKTKINELPQLFNVLFGNMSLIGPRPLTMENFYKYRIDIQKLIATVKPGLSGIGSIIFRDEEKLLSNSDRPIEFYDEVITPYKGNLEKWFVENYNIKMYFKSIILTAWIIIFPMSKAKWFFFKTLPKVPKKLKKLL
jgi:lipopolysaccharide/colanic/teichoic acid biosynthesis glycosyltransferase